MDSEMITVTAWYGQTEVDGDWRPVYQTADGRFFADLSSNPIRLFDWVAAEGEAVVEVPAGDPSIMWFEGTIVRDLHSKNIFYGVGIDRLIGEVELERKTA